MIREPNGRGPIGVEELDRDYRCILGRQDLQVEGTRILAVPNWQEVQAADLMGFFCAFPVTPDQLNQIAVEVLLKDLGAFIKKPGVNWLRYNNFPSVGAIQLCD